MGVQRLDRDEYSRPMENIHESNLIHVKIFIYSDVKTKSKCFKSFKVFNNVQKHFRYSEMFIKKK